MTGQRQNLACSAGQADVGFDSVRVMVVVETSGEVLLRKDISTAALRT